MSLQGESLSLKQFFEKCYSWEHEVPDWLNPFKRPEYFIEGNLLDDETSLADRCFSKRDLQKLSDARYIYFRLVKGFCDKKQSYCPTYKKLIEEYSNRECLPKGCVFVNGRVRGPISFLSELAIEVADSDGFRLDEDWLAQKSPEERNKELSHYKKMVGDIIDFTNKYGCFPGEGGSYVWNGSYKEYQEKKGTSELFERLERSVLHLEDQIEFLNIEIPRPDSAFKNYLKWKEKKFIHACRSCLDDYYGDYCKKPNIVVAELLNIYSITDYSEITASTISERLKNISREQKRLERTGWDLVKTSPRRYPRKQLSFRRNSAGSIELRL